MKKKATEIIDQRQAELAERLDPGWQPETVSPVLSPGTIDYEMSGRTRAINYGGLGMVQQFVRSLDLPAAIDERLHLLKRHLPYQESDHVLNLVYNILSGGQCLEDLELRREDVGYLNAMGARRIPDPTTAGDFLRRFSEADVESLMDVVNGVSQRIWAQQSSEERELALIDVDGTMVETSGECKEGAAFDYKGRWGYGPLVVSLANSQEVLYVVNRAANRPSHDGAVKWMDKAVKGVKARGFERIRLRGDTDFSLTTSFDCWTQEGVEFVFGIDAMPNLVRLAEGVESDRWQPLKRQNKGSRRTARRRRPENTKKKAIKAKGWKNLRLESEHVAEVEYRPRKTKRSYRLVILRKNVSVEKGEERLFPEIRYFFYITNVSRRELNTKKVVEQSNARCHQENLIEQLKNGVGATRMPAVEFVANWAYLVIASLAWNLKSWLGLVLPERFDSRSLIRMEFRRFLNELIQVPVQILRTGRRLIYRLLAYNRWVKVLLDATAWLKRARFA